MILIVFETIPKFFPVNVGEEGACAKQYLSLLSWQCQIYNVGELGRFHGPLGPLREQGNHRNSKAQLVKLKTVVALGPGVKLA
jgi:hypothetical protein